MLLQALLIFLPPFLQAYRVTGVAFEGSAWAKYDQFVSEREMEQAIAPLFQRIALLEARLRELGCEPPP